MDASKKKQFAIIGCVGVALWLLLRNSANQEQLIMQPGAADVVMNVTPSIPDAGWIPGNGNPNIIFGPGGNPIIFLTGDQSAPDININIPDVMLGALSRQYIPMFGFVGVQGVGAQ